MVTTLYDKYDKKLIPALPQACFKGRIVVVLSEQEANAAVDYLMQQQILGFDTETRPTFKKGESRKVALLQVSTHDTCFLFRLNVIGMPQCIIRLLENTQIPIVGLSVHDDIHSLQKRETFTPGWFIDIQNIVGELGIKDRSLQKLFANMFGEKIAKREQLTNWEKDVLTDKQKTYAATDAWACIMLYEKLKDLKNTGRYDLVVTETEDEKTEVKDTADNTDNGYEI